MVIDPGNNLNVNKNGVGTTSHGAKSQAADKAHANHGTAAQKPAASSDTVSLSGAAKSLGQIENQIAEESGVDEAKVEAIKQALADGSYEVNADKIAGGMLSQDQMFS